YDMFLKIGLFSGRDGEIHENGGIVVPDIVAIMSQEPFPGYKFVLPVPIKIGQDSGMGLCGNRTYGFSGKGPVLVLPMPPDSQGMGGSAQYIVPAIPIYIHYLHMGGRFPQISGMKDPIARFFVFFSLKPTFMDNNIAKSVPINIAISQAVGKIFRPGYIFRA